MTSFYDFSVLDSQGREQSLQQYEGQLVLVVNVASQCGLTPQYAGLENLYRTYQNRGLVVLGFPCNQFGRQEPGDDQRIQDFCQSNYDVTFPVFAKIDVNGPHAIALYRWLKTNKPGLLGLPAIKWNFTKFLINPEGQVVERFAPTCSPAKLSATVESYLPAAQLA